MHFKGCLKFLLNFYSCSNFSQLLHLILRKNTLLLIFLNFSLFLICFIFFFLFILHIQARFDFLSWQDGVYAVFAGLAVTVASLVAGFVVYRLCVRIVKYIGRKW